VVLDYSALAVEVILGESDIPRVTHNVDDSRIARIEVLVALQYTGSRHARKMPLGERFRVRGQLVDIGKVGMFLRIHEVRYQEPSPGITRFRVGNKKRVIGKNDEVTPGTVQSEGLLGSGN
jgi:hypothetical protein